MSQGSAWTLDTNKVSARGPHAPTLHERLLSRGLGPGARHPVSVGDCWDAPSRLGRVGSRTEVRTGGRRTEPLGHVRTPYPMYPVSDPGTQEDPPGRRHPRTGVGWCNVGTHTPVSVRSRLVLDSGREGRSPGKGMSGHDGPRCWLRSEGPTGREEYLEVLRWGRTAGVEGEELPVGCRGGGVRVTWVWTRCDRTSVLPQSKLRHRRLRPLTCQGSRPRGTSDHFTVTTHGS